MGYTFFNYAPILKYSPLMGVMFLGFAFVLSGLACVSMDKLRRFRNHA